MHSFLVCVVIFYDLCFASLFERNNYDRKGILWKIRIKALPFELTINSLQWVGILILVSVRYVRCIANAIPLGMRVSCIVFSGINAFTGLPPPCTGGTYGEITREGVDTLAEMLNLKGEPAKVFYDLGSGAGKAVLHFKTAGTHTHTTTLSLYFFLIVD